MRRALGRARKLATTWEVSIAGRPLGEVRREVRRRVAGVDDDRPVIVTGHQPESIHPGVWAKHVVATRLAQAAAGVAVNLVVDNDAPQQTVVIVPTVRDGHLRQEAIPFADLPRGVPYECIPRLDADHTHQFQRALREALGERFDRSMLGVYFDAFAGAADAADFVDQAVAARTAVERVFGVNMAERRVSRCWMWPLLAEVLAGAARFFDCYNAALAEYRTAHGVRGARRPIPDLLRDGQRFELPFWVMHPGQRRSRLFVERRREALHLYADRCSVGSLALGRLKRWESGAEAVGDLGSVVFRPRALTLTLWARMLLADLFVHGIGGAKYDRITDLLITRYFGVQPPPMACVSATLRLDLPRHEATVQAQRALARQRRDLTWNPQRRLSGGSDIDELVKARAQTVERSLTLRAAGRRRRTERREVFHQIRSISQRMLALRPDAERDLDERIQRMAEALEENEVADRRDYFFALYDRSALRQLCDALPAVGEFRV